MASDVASVDRDHMNTFRRSLVTLAALALMVTLPSPASASPVPLTTWIVTYAAPPSAFEVGVLSGVSDAVHGFTEIPAAVVVAPTAAGSLLRSLPGVVGLYANETYHYLADAVLWRSPPPRRISAAAAESEIAGTVGG